MIRAVDVALAGRDKQALPECLELKCVLRVVAVAHSPEGAGLEEDLHVVGSIEKV